MEKNGLEQSNLEEGSLNESQKKEDKIIDQNPPKISQESTSDDAIEVGASEEKPTETTENISKKEQPQDIEESSVVNNARDESHDEENVEKVEVEAAANNDVPEDNDPAVKKEVEHEKLEHSDQIEDSSSSDSKLEDGNSTIPDKSKVEKESSIESWSTSEEKDVPTEKESQLEQQDQSDKVETSDSPDKKEEEKNDIAEDKPTQEIEASKDAQSISEDKTADTKQEDNEEQAHLDYSNYTKKQMVQVLESLLKEDDYSQVGRILKEIKKPYDILASKERKEAYKRYVEDGGEKDGFEYRMDELDQRFHEAFGKLRERKNQYFNSLEKQKEQNLHQKQEILEKLRELVDSEETGTSIKAIKDLQKQWKEVGVIPSSQVKSLWANYNALLDRFYDQRSIYFELKELDRKKNYDLKIELCVKAEELENQENIREAIKQLNELHEEFKHIGPVPADVQEAVWERFKLASDKIYARRKEFYEKLKDEFKLNEVAKEALIEKVVPFAEFQSDRISDWNAKTKDIIAIQKEWEAIGSLSKEKAKSINKRFWSAFKSFFHQKGQFFKKIEEERKENLKLKQALVDEADALKDSDDFRQTSDELKKLQRRWKEIGPVPEKFRNEVFKKFKKACDHFFDRRRANSGKIEKDYEENLKKKEALCEELENIAKSDDIDINRVKTIESEWAEIGFVPKSSIKAIQSRYSVVIASITDNADISESEKHKMRFSAQFSSINYGPGAEKLIHKKEGALRRQITTLENDIGVWKNNIDFFASSKNADKLKKEFQVKIDKANEQLKSLKEQLKVISNI